MPTLFTKIIEGDIPGRFVWRQYDVVAFLTINPITPGHTLVVPAAEVDHWVDLDPVVAARCFEVAQVIGRAQMEAFSPTRIGLIIAGLEVPHTHLHLIPIDSEGDLSFDKADPSPAPEALDDAAERIREALRTAGHGHATPSDCPRSRTRAGFAGRREALARAASRPKRGPEPATIQIPKATGR
jgi:histidine triad (HIT) family protein